MALTFGVLDAPTGKSLHLFLLLLMSDLQFDSKSFCFVFFDRPTMKMESCNIQSSFAAQE